MAWIFFERVSKIFQDLLEHGTTEGIEEKDDGSFSRDFESSGIGLNNGCLAGLDFWGDTFQIAACDRAELR